MVNLTKAFTFLAALSLVGGTWANTSNMHTRFKDPQKIERFNNISKELRCQCGCNLSLDGCNHPSTCLAWTLRAVIEGMIEDGKSDEFIIQGFKNGFGKKLAENHQAFTKARENPQIVQAMAVGFGTAAFSMPENDYSIAFLIFAAIAMLGVFALLIRRRLSPVQATAEANPVQPEKKNELYGKLYED